MSFSKYIDICICIYIYFFFTLGILVKGKWRNLRDNFRREYAKISDRTTGSEALDDSPLSAWKYYKQLLFLVDMLSSRKLQTSIPYLPSQTSGPADDNNQEDEYGMPDDSIPTPVVIRKKQKSWVLLRKIHLQAQV